MQVSLYSLLLSKKTFYLLKYLNICLFISRYSSQRTFLVFRCSMVYIDFEGRSDGESIKRILSLVNPRNLVSLQANRLIFTSLAYEDTFKRNHAN